MSFQTRYGVPVIVCDKCGAVFEPEKSDNIPEMVSQFSAKMIAQGWTVGVNEDYCPGCS